MSLLDIYIEHIPDIIFTITIVLIAYILDKILDKHRRQ